jgi:outer membrane protein OmpA-like peptidoglycan-associated protein
LIPGGWAASPLPGFVLERRADFPSERSIRYGRSFDQIERHRTTLTERAAGAAAGFAAGALVGALLGHYVCDPVVDEPAPDLAPPPPTPVSGTEIAEIRGAHFAFDSARLTAEGTSRLGEAVATMNEHPGITVRCEGHTDSIGSEAYNLSLGQRRAEALAAHLVAQGIDPGRIATRSLGESLPAASNDTEEGRARNRRVEIIVD